MTLENSYLFREIHQQPSVLETFLRQEEQSIAKLAAEIRKRDVDYVVMPRVAPVTMPVAMRNTCSVQSTGYWWRLPHPVFFPSTNVLLAFATPWSSASARAAKAPTSSLCWPKPAGKGR